MQDDSWTDLLWGALAAVGFFALAAILLGGCGTTTRTVTAAACAPGQLPASGACAPALAVHPPGVDGSGVRPEGARPGPPPRGTPPPRAGAMHVSDGGIAFIAGFEGFSSCPYWDPYGRVWTRGYGETEGIGRYSPCISAAYGRGNLRYRLERFYEWAIRELSRALNQNQWDALASFAWNLGAYIYRGTTIGRHLRERRDQQAADDLLAYTHAGGQVLAGLVRRRYAERALFLRGAPPPPACNHACKQQKLWREYRLRNARRYYLRVHACRHMPPGPRPRTRAQRHACSGVKHNGDVGNATIARYHREGVY